MPRLRVFISYAREDDALAARAEDALRARGLEPLRDRNIRPGRDFRSDIGELIARAHIFMPIITEIAQSRAWVHQETGFAVALGIPVLPVAAKSLPGEMIASVQTLSVNPDFSDLEQRIQEQDFDRVMEEATIPPYSLVDIVYWPEERIRKLTLHAQRVMQFPEFDRLRQKAPMSSFSIPDADVQDSIWTSRDGNTPRSEYYRNLQRDERRALERLARLGGVSLILDPSVELKQGYEAKKVYLTILANFLRSMPDDKVEVVISRRRIEGNLTIIGSFLVAESVTPRPGGYRQTVFNWHAPTVLQQIRKFDNEMKEIMEQNSWGSTPSPEVALNEIERVIAT